LEVGFAIGTMKKLLLWAVGIVGVIVVISHSVILSQTTHHWIV
jgi:mannose/fructose/N-acetylgalactosamine-specific phosphotransferase system component IIC